MSMSHKAFSLDWERFADELRPLIEAALRTNDDSSIREFIARHNCCDPNDGEALGEAWVERSPDCNVQDLADIALTAFYQPANDFGLGDEWRTIGVHFSDEARAALLGNPLAAGAIAFDPGLMGSYFQSPEQARRSLRIVEKLEALTQTPFIAGLRAAAHGERGLYVTF